MGEDEPDPRGATTGDEPAWLQRLATGFGRPVDGPVAAQLLQFVHLLHTWNARINLTGAATPTAIITEQLPDSFALAGIVPPGVRLLDVGSGGGLPAIPFALLRRDVRVTLMEPRSRRRAFLATALRELHLTADLRPDRVEQLPPGGYDVACARAVFPPDEWLARGLPLVAPGGLVALFLNDDAGWSPPPGTAVVASEVYPVEGSRRRLVVVRRPEG